MIDFPANPTVGQQFTAAGVTWVWDSVKWTASGLGVAYLPLAGGTMLGPIVLAADPAAALQPATKQYVDGGRYGDNRIVNGDMRIDQRNNGASGTANGYTVDRWQYQGSVASKLTWGRNVSSVPGPANFPYCLGAMNGAGIYAPVAGDYFEYYQIIEADMVSDFAWGTSSAQPVTLSFLAYTNVALSGSFSGSIRNLAGTRSYPFNFSIPSIGTWTKIVITIPGDTAGTWVMSGNAGSVVVTFDLGSGTSYRAAANAWANGFYLGVTGAANIQSAANAGLWVTGVKLEIGSVATPFNRQSLAKSLADCQRYYQRIGGVMAGDVLIQGVVNAAAQAVSGTIGIVAMRAAPTVGFAGSWSLTNTSGATLYPGLSSIGVQAAASAAGQLTLSSAVGAYLSCIAEL